MVRFDKETNMKIRLEKADFNFMEFRDFLISIEACQEAIDWVGDMDPETAWVTCRRGDWMEWLFVNCDPDVVQASAAYAQASAAYYDQARAAYDQASAAYAQARAAYDQASAAYDQARAVYDQACDQARAARTQALDQARAAYADAIRLIYPTLPESIKAALKEAEGELRP